MVFFITVRLFFVVQKLKDVGFWWMKGQTGLRCFWDYNI